jgi:hypothetical protein
VHGNYRLPSAATAKGASRRTAAPARDRRQRPGVEAVIGTAIRRIKTGLFYVGDAQKPRNLIVD